MYVRFLFYYLTILLCLYCSCRWAAEPGRRIRPSLTVVRVATFAVLAEAEYHCDYCYYCCCGHHHRSGFG